MELEEAFRLIDDLRILGATHIGVTCHDDEVMIMSNLTDIAIGCATEGEAIDYHDIIHSYIGHLPQFHAEGSYSL